MRLLISMASIDPVRGGPSNAARALARSLVALGHEVVLIGHDDGRGPSMQRCDGYSTRLFALNARRWQVSIPYAIWCWKHVSEFDGIIINSLFLSHTFFVSRIARLRGVPYAVRPHGSLNAADIRRSRSGFKRVYLRFFDVPALTRAMFVFCTSESERDEVARFRTAPCRVIPLGVDVPDLRARSLAARDRHRILFLGRLTEKKGVDILLLALRKLKAHGCEFLAEIVGPADGDLRERYQSMIEEFELDRRVRLLPFADAQEKERLFANSGVFVLPSEDENFGIAPAEALARGLPVVVTPGVSHAPSVLANRLGLVPERTAEQVAAALLEIMEIDLDEWIAMSDRARAYARRNFDWQRTASDVVEAFCRPAVPVSV